MTQARNFLARSAVWAVATVLLAGAASAADEAPKAAKSAKAAAKPGAAAGPAAAGPAAAVAPVAAVPATAGAAGAGAPAVNAPPSASEVTLKRGLEAYQKGNMASAIGSFSSAMSQGGLSRASLAQALYHRGLAYRKQGKPAQAIPDLTNSLYITDGLSQGERAEATAARAAAYREAGIADPGGVPAQASTATAPVQAAASAAPAAAAPAAASSPWQTAAASPAPASAPSLSAMPAAAPAADTSSSGSGVGGFFSNLFGGSSQPAPSAPAAEVTTASTGPSAGEPAAAVSSWSSGTAVSTGAPAKAAAKSQRTAALATPAAPVADAAPAVAAPAQGKFKLQVAAVRSRAEAEALAARVVKEHGGKLGNRAPVIEEAVFGNMGTFYRVNVGPYASAAEPDGVCKSLRTSGFDCLVATH